jgi:hypothetical protein
MVLFLSKGETLTSVIVLADKGTDAKWSDEPYVAMRWYRTVATLHIRFPSFHFISPDFSETFPRLPFTCPAFPKCLLRLLYLCLGNRGRA